MKVCFWFFQPEANCFQGSLPIGREKSFFQINGYTPGTWGCVNLLKWGNHIWNSSCSWSHHLVKFMIIHWYSLRTLCFLHRLISELTKDVIEIIDSAFFKSLMVLLIPAMLPEMQYWFWLTIFQSRHNSSGFHLASAFANLPYRS